MNPADTLAPIALDVLLGGGVVLLLVELVGAWRRRHADPWRDLARRDAELHRRADTPQQ